MGLTIGDDTNLSNGEKIADESDIKELEEEIEKWKSRAKWWSVVSFVAGLAFSLALTFAL